MRLLYFFISYFIVVSLHAQQLYSKAYGESRNTPIIFIHGGPSGNANLFEGTTAELLAAKGFYVIVYDRRGEGRSKDANAIMNFQETFVDLLNVYAFYHLDKAILVGHSFGGIIATLFTEKYPNKVSALVLAGALFAQQETYDHICAQAKKHYKNDPSKISELLDINRLDKHSHEYRKKCFGIASVLNMFDMPIPTTESKALREAYEKTDLFKTSFRNQESPVKFFANEKRNNTNTKVELQKIVNQKIPVFGIYGANDAIFSKNQLNNLKQIIGKKQVKIIPNCSHFLFVDQQKAFLSFFGSVIK